MEPYDISKILNDMELDLIASMKKALSKGNAEDWQKQKLQALGKFRTTNAKIIKDYSSSLDKETLRLLKDSFTKGAKNTDNILKRILTAKTKPITDIGDEGFFKINEKRINSLIGSVNNNLDKAQNAVLRMSDDIYRQTIFKSQMNLNAGALSLNQAVDMATKDFLDKGFNCITYKDGRKVNIASYAEMVLRTSSQRAVFTGEGSRRDEWNVHTVVVSAHNNCSELCIPWQGKVYIDNVYSSGEKGDGKYPLLSTAINNGLFHPNCRHNMSTWFEGINTLPEQVDNKEVLRNYEAEQKQRYMERQIRKYKRHEVGNMDPQNIKNASDKVKEWQGQLRQHLKDNPQLRRDYSREKVKDTIEKNGNNDIIKLPDTIIGYSIGAKAKNYEILMPNGDFVNLAEGTKITNSTVIAGKGKNRQIDMIDVLIANYGGEPSEWQKAKGFGYVNFEGEILMTELHWYQEPTVGKVNMKIKQQKDGELFIYED